jgi:GNAT superfamily N-acetyltransferase
MVADYVEHLIANVPGGFDCATDHPPPPGAFEAPRGTFLVMYDDVTPIGCGAVWEMEPGIAEVRRMWVSPDHQGTGLGRRMLDAIESAAGALGCRTARLDTMAALGAAVAMYRSQGYREIGDYNANPNADLWFERPLRGR